MDSRQWAILLDDEGMSDEHCKGELAALVRAYVSARADDPDEDPAADPPPLPPGVTLEDYIAAAIENRGRDPHDPDPHDSPAGRAHGAPPPPVPPQPDQDDPADPRAPPPRPEDQSMDMFDYATREPLRDLSSLAVWTVSTAKPGNGVEQLLDTRLKSYWQSDGQQPHTISAQFTSKLKLSEVRLYLDFTQDDSYTPAIISIRVGSSFHDLRYVRRNKELSKPTGWVRIPLSRKGIAAQDDFDDVSSLPSEEDDIETMAAGELAERDQRRCVRAEHRRQQRALERRAANEKKTADELTAAIRAGRGGATEEAVLQEIRRRRVRDAAFVRAHMLQIVIHTNHQNGRDSHVRRVKVLGPAQQVADPSARFSSVAFQMYETIR